MYSLVVRTKGANQMSKIVAFDIKTIKYGFKQLT